MLFDFFSTINSIIWYLLLTEYKQVTGIRENINRYIFLLINVVIINALLSVINVALVLGPGEFTPYFRIMEPVLGPGRMVLPNSHFRNGGIKTKIFIFL